MCACDHTSRKPTGRNKQRRKEREEDNDEASTRSYVYRGTRVLHSYVYICRLSACTAAFHRRGR